MAGGAVEYAEDARNELDELYLWISVETGPNAAAAVVKRLDRAVRNLAAFPEMGLARPDLPDAPRTFSVHPWLLLYRPLAGRRGIRVLRVIDGRRDIGDALKAGV